MGKKMTWLEFVQGWHQAQANDAAKATAKTNQALLDEVRRTKYQRLPDGTWGYPSQAQAEDSQAAFERGWRTGWVAGYEAAKEKVST